MVLCPRPVCVARAQLTRGDRPTALSEYCIAVSGALFISREERCLSLAVSGCPDSAAPARTLPAYSITTGRLKEKWMLSVKSAV